MRIFCFASLFLFLTACGGNDSGESESVDNNDEVREEQPPSKEQESPLASWSGLVTGDLSRHLTTNEAKQLIGTTADIEVDKDEYADRWRYRWRDEQGKPLQLALDRGPMTDEQTIFLNAQGYRSAVAEGLGEEVDLNEFGVWAFWRQERKTSRLVVFTRTAMVSLSPRSLAPADGKRVAVQAARHLFASNPELRDG